MVDNAIAAAGGNAPSPIISGIYGGGPIYKDGGVAIPNLKLSGFAEVVVWNIAVDDVGRLNFNYEFPLVDNGAYVGDDTHPDFRRDIAALKVAPTSVVRITFSVGSSNPGVFEAIRDLIASQGSGPTSILYRNFQALKEALPDIDCIDFDDENCYDQPSMVSFALMLAEIGFQVSLCPYGENAFWTAVAASANAQRPGTVSAVHLQCYDGGWINTPCAGWDFGALPVYPGLSIDTETDPAPIASAMAGWARTCGISGGFIWKLDDCYADLARMQAYAAAINSTLARGGAA